MSVCLWNKWCWWKILAFAPKMCSADAKCEYLLYLLYKMDDIDTKSKRLFSIKMNIVDEKCENLLSEMGGNIADEKSERLLFEWTVQIGKVSIFFEINIGDGKSERLFSIWYLRWQSPYPLSYPLLVVFYGIKWRIRWKRNPKFVKIDLKMNGI